MSRSQQRARELEHWQVLATHARSFRWGSALLRPLHRRRVASLYAFCRAIDDLADADCVRPESRTELALLEAALAAEPQGERLWPEKYLWFRSLCLECDIDFRVVRELLQGMRFDLGRVRLESDQELLRYCYWVAGTVGLMMCSVLGVRDPRASRHAVHLGIAMQLTNISRDVLEDARASRVYLPASRLAKHGVAPEDLLDGRADAQAVSSVVDELLTMADDYYRSGERGLPFLPRRARWAILVASRLYRGIGRRLRRRHQSNPLLGRVIVPWSEKLLLALCATGTWWWLALRRRLPGRDNEGAVPLAGLPASVTQAPRSAAHREAPDA